MATRKKTKILIQFFILSLFLLSCFQNFVKKDSKPEGATKPLVAEITSSIKQKSNPWGLMANDDGDSLFSPISKMDYTNEDYPQIHMNMLEEKYKRLSDYGVKTLKLNVYSNLTYFPVDADSTLSSLDANSGLFDDPNFGSYSGLKPRVQLAKILFDKIRTDANPAKFDPISKAIDAFKLKADNKVILSLRIADTHIIQRESDINKVVLPFNQHPYVTQYFKSLCPELTSGKSETCNYVIGQGRSPLPSDQRIENLLNFTSATVRGQFLKAVREALSRYGSRVDGVEIDFTRSSYLFPYGEGEKRQLLIDDLIYKIHRTVLNQTRGKGVLMVRVPSSLNNAKRLGLNVESWIKSGNVQVVIPSQTMTIDHNMNIFEFTNIAHLKNVLIYGALPLRRSSTNWVTNKIDSWSTTKFDDLQISDKGYLEQLKEYRESINLSVSPDYVLGAATNYIQAGADGLELYNFIGSMPAYSPILNKPSKGWFDYLLRGLVNLNSYSGPLMYAASTGYNLHTNDAQDSKQPLPLLLKSNSVHQVSLKIGKRPVISTNVTLRLSFLNENVEDCRVSQVMSNGSIKLLADPQIQKLSFILKPALNTSFVIKNSAAARSSASLIYQMSSERLSQGLNTFQVDCDTDNLLMDLEVLLKGDRIVL